VLHSLYFFKRKERKKKRGEKIVLRFHPSHVASNFNQKLVQVFMITTQCKSYKRVAGIDKEKDWWR
jgi:hypothetical protein